MKDPKTEIHLANLDDSPVLASVSEDKTVISQRPVSPPEAFYHPVVVTELAKVLAGKQLDHFLIDELVGGGGMGAVFRGRDLRLDRTVAVKVIPSARCDAETLRRFRVEAQSAAKLDHPNIARVYYVGESGQWNYIVFEFIEGTNLKDLVLQNGPLSVDDSVFYLQQIAEALEHASSREVVHRDIKPSNILVTPEGQAKLVDMGLARTTELNQSSHDVTASGVTLGTFDYISPEQAKDPRDADVRSDLYSLGCTWYYLLTGQAPFPEGTALQKLLKHGTEKAEDPRRFRDDLSPELVAILYRMMAKRPVDRYQRALDLISDLRLLAEYDDLPRSRSAGWPVAHPNVIQRSAVERLMPWMVSLSFLFGLSIWLQSLDNWSSAIELKAPQIDSKLPQVDPVTNTRIERTDMPAIPSLRESAGLSSDRPAASQLRSDVSMNTNSQPANPNAPDHSMTSDGSKKPGPKKLADAFDDEERNTEEIGSTSGSDDPTNRSSLPLKPHPPAVTSDSVSSTIVVWPPTQIGPLADSAWSESLALPTLEQAIAAANKNPRIQQIRIACDRLICGPVRIERNGLRISAARGFKPVLIWADFQNRETTANHRGEKVWFDLGQHELHLEGLQVQVGDIQDNLAVFKTNGSARLKLDQCAVSMENLSAEHSLTFLNCQPPNQSAKYFGDVDTVSGMPLADPLQIVAENCSFRGEATWLVCNSAMRSEVRCDQCFFALREWMFDLVGTNVPSRNFPVYRLEMNKSTIATDRGLIRVTLDTQHPFGIRLARESNDCVYWMPPGGSLIEIRGVADRTVADEMLDLRGEDNAYDEGIDSFASIETSDGQIFRLEATDMDSRVVRERGSENSVRWLQPQPPDLPFSKRRLSDYRQRSGNFSPGVDPSKLPSFGNGTFESPSRD